MPQLIADGTHSRSTTMASSLRASVSCAAAPKAQVREAAMPDRDEEEGAGGITESRPSLPACRSSALPLCLLHPLALATWSSALHRMPVRHREPLLVRMIIGWGPL
jgi:hypothetical protein